jgi:hypothetical protein
MLSEADGRIVLREAFESKGYKIQENYLLHLNGLEIELDGYDAAARVGYEYLTSEDGLESEALKQLLDSPQYKIFLMDEQQVPTAWVLAEAVFDFFRQSEGQA